MFRLYRPLEVSENIVVGADPGNGVSYAAACGISTKYRDVPFTFHARVESPEFGYELNKIGLFVKRKTTEFPLLAVERNIGQATISKLLDLDYPSARLYKQKTFDRILTKTQDRIGWMTTSANRRKMLDELAMDVRKLVLMIYDEELYNEMLTFVIEERTQQPRPESGTFSDLIMALAIANQLVKEIKPTAIWAPQAKPEDPRRLPAKAQGFIVEPFQEHRDWRNP